MAMDTMKKQTIYDCLLVSAVSIVINVFIAVSIVINVFIANTFWLASY